MYFDRIPKETFDLSLRLVSDRMYHFYNRKTQPVVASHARKPTIASGLYFIGTPRQHGTLVGKQIVSVAVTYLRRAHPHAAVMCTVRNSARSPANQLPRRRPHPARTMHAPPRIAVQDVSSLVPGYCMPTCKSLYAYFW